MRAVNLTLAAVELDPANGPGLLLPATEESGGGHVRDLAEVTDRERALAEAGTIALEGETPSDKYDRMDRKRLEREVAGRELTVERGDGRTDIPPTEDEYRHALRVADTTGGESS